MSEGWQRIRRTRTIGRGLPSGALQIQGRQQGRQRDQRRQSHSQGQALRPHSGSSPPGRPSHAQGAGAASTHQSSSQAAIGLDRPTSAVGTGHRSAKDQQGCPTRQPQPATVERPARWDGRCSSAAPATNRPLPGPMGHLGDKGHHAQAHTQKPSQAKGLCSPGRVHADLLSRFCHGVGSNDL